MPDTARDEIVQSFYRVRQTLGYLGLVLPVLLILGGVLAQGRIEPALSDYYHTLLRDVLVGTMAAIGLFLICYKGYKREQEERYSDDRITTVAGVAALGVALFPNQGQVPASMPEAWPQALLGPLGSNIAHFAAAILFLLCLAYMCLVKFARTANPRRRRIYRRCGAIIVIATVLTIFTSFFKAYGAEGPKQFVNGWCLVLVFESIGIWAFSVSWLVKGRADEGLARAFHLRAPKPD